MQRFSARVARICVPISSDQPLHAGGEALRGDKKKQTSRCNLGVRWVFLELPAAAIAFSRRGTYDCATLLVNGSTFCQGRRLRQLPLVGEARIRMDCARLARAEPGEAAQLYYSSGLGPVARVSGRCGRRGRRAWRSATRHPSAVGMKKSAM